MNRSLSTVAIMAIVRRECKRSGLTQPVLAERLGVSHPTLKRWLVGQGLGFDDLVRVLEALGLGFEEVIAELESEARPSFQYTFEQEKFFSAHHEHLSYFDHLLRGEGPKEIETRHRLTHRSTRRYLKDLERLGLIDVLPEDRVKLLVKGEPVWRKDGPLRRSLRERAMNEFLAKDETAKLTDLFLHTYTQEDKEKVLRFVEDLKREARGAERRSRSAPGRKNQYGLMIGFAPFSWSLLDRIPELR